MFFFRKVLPAFAAVRQDADHRLEEALGKLKSSEEAWPWVGGRNIWHGAVGSIGGKKPSSTEKGSNISRI